MQHLFLGTVHFFIRCGGGGGGGGGGDCGGPCQKIGQGGGGGQAKKILGVKRWSPKEFFQVLQ